MSLFEPAGKRGLVGGIARASSIAYGRAKAFHAACAERAITYLDANAALTAARRGERAAP